MHLAWNRDLTGYITSINAPLNNTGETPLLRHCINEGVGFCKDTMQTLLDMGADIQARDNRSMTCLHICFLNLNLHGNISREFEVIRLLLERGADPRAANIWGITVSHYAYRHGDVDYGSYSGDLWDSALQSCEYNIAEFRAKYPRKEKYTKKYRRKDFKLLWRGREHLCPYWSKSSWSSPYDHEANLHGLVTESEGSEEWETVSETTDDLESDDGGAAI
jgi:hypothetical protein